MIHVSISEWSLVFLVAWVLKATLIMIAAITLTWVLPKASAAVRHLIWLVALCGTAALPILTVILPDWYSPKWQLPLERAYVIAPVDPTSDRQPTPPRSNLEAQEQESAFASTLTQSGSTLGWSRAVVTIWLTGLALLGFRTFQRVFSLCRIAQRDLQVIPDTRILAILKDCVAELGIHRPVALVSGMHRITVPMTWGYWRPTVLLPVTASTWGEPRVRAVLLHELAHIRRGDWLSVLLSQCVCALLWFHPLVWVAARALRCEAEQAADDCVITAGVRPSEYGSELLAILQLSAKQNTTTSERNLSMTPAISMAQPQTIEQRIRALLDEKRSRRTLSGGSMAMACVVALTTLLPLAALQVTAAETAPATGATATPATPAILDLSTPESALKAFVTALNSGNLPGASGAVQGGKLQPINPGLAAKFSEGRPHFEISGVAATIEGDTATVTIASTTTTSVGSQSPDAKQKVDRQGEQRLTLRRESGAWKIVPIQPDAPKGADQTSMFLNIASALAASDEVLARYRDRAQQGQCASNLKQLAIAAHMYAQAHGDRLDFTVETAMKALLPQLENNEKLFSCPSNDKVRYAFNQKLVKRLLADISKPAETVLFYETTAGEGVRPGGVAAPVAPTSMHGETVNVVFVDGHVETINAKDTVSLRWEP